MNIHSIAFLWIAAVSAHSQTPTADAVVATMAKRYATLRSYQDTGVVLSHWKDHAVPDELPFKTYFARPDNFRFEWISDHPHLPLRHIAYSYVIWSNSSGAYLYRDGLPNVEQKQDLSMAVAALTGVSHGSAHTVPGLLLKTIGGFKLTELRGLTLLDQVDFEMTTCFRVRGTHPRGVVYDMWIGVNDYLLRKLQMQLIPGEIEEEIHRDIQTDVDIPDSLFRFEAPK